MPKSRIIALGCMALSAGLLAAGGALAWGADITHLRPAQEAAGSHSGSAPRPFMIEMAATGVEVINGAHSLCLDADKSGDGSNGDKVQLWSCSGASNQLWTYYANGEFVNAAHHLCLDADKSGDGSNGDKVQLWSCSGASNQQWFDGPYAADAANNAHGLCLDADAAYDGDNGDTVQLWTCGDNKLNQQW